jgi:hypothetical protein
MQARLPEFSSRYVYTATEANATLNSTTDVQSSQ